MAVSRYDDLKLHLGHDVVVVGYGLSSRQDPENVAVECESCGEVLLDFDRDEPPVVFVEKA